ncbi:hypothetical protein Micbo1qcDRAFT_174574 [Microdochium bolleyi]|uniref:Uncharacterized protein n=1 Tax=Microdochium bolleyi TaxID=196109 RepID=A0A136J8Q1_9PEZI|nr:hypothetical protein Micbo1qcDRAFT_174574 [Microdochium bolleyi]
MTGPLQNLPVELRLLILQHICDIPTMMKACRAGPCLWAPYATCKETIIEQVLRNEIGPDLMPIAIASDLDLLDRFSHVFPSTNLSEVLEYGQVYLNQSATIEGPSRVLIKDFDCDCFSLVQALNSSRNHSRISRLANRCAALFMYKKALYTWDILSSIFPARDEDDLYNEVWKVLWGHFTPWEFLQVKEVLRCLDRLLVDKFAEDVEESGSGQLMSLTLHILCGDPLDRDGPEVLMPSDTWQFQMDKLIPLLDCVGLDCLHIVDAVAYHSVWSLD